MTLFRAAARSVSALKLPQRVPFTSGRATGASFGGGLFSPGQQDGMTAYRDLGAAYGPIRRICQSVSQVKWSVYQQSGGLGNTDRTLIDDAVAPARHPATALLTHPNPFMTWRRFAYLQQLWQLTLGGVYWLICDEGSSPGLTQQSGVSAGLELWPIRADRITPVPDPDQYLAGYWYTLGVNQVWLPVTAVIPIGWPDPFDPLRFAGPLGALRTDLEAEGYAAQYNRNTFVNDARPGGVIEYETPLSRDRFDELNLRWREQHQGLANVKRTAIIEGGKWVDVSQSNQDMQYLQLRHLTREEVMFALGMPFAMMQSNEVNLANAQTAESVYFRFTLKDLLENIKEAVNERILWRLGDNLTADYDLPAPEDEAFDVYESMAGWIGGLLTQNEARQGIGYDALPDGDRYLWQLTGTPPPIAAAPPKKPTRLDWQPPAQKGADPFVLDGDVPTDWSEQLAWLDRQYAQYRASRQPALSVITQARCPDCHRLLARNVNADATLWCQRCRSEKSVASA